MTEAHGPCFGSFGTSGEDIQWSALPGCAVQNGLAVRGKARGTDAAAAEGELTVERRFQGRGGEEQFAGVESCGSGDEQAEGENQGSGRVLALNWDRRCGNGCARGGRRL